jgi:lipopolysaccharide export system permease protein
MPIIWRYLLAQYFKVVIFCSTAFVLLLLALRLEEIAHFATLGAEGLNVLRFIFYQIPYILPIALPISALIASIVLFRRFSKQQELTALRTAGLPIIALLAPLLIAAALLAMANLYIVSELATSAHLAASQIKSQLRSVNPLLLINNKHLMKLKGIYVDTLGSSRLGESASQLIVAMPNRSDDQINLLLAENVQANPEQFTAKQVTFLSSLHAGDKKQVGDDLLVENISSTSITAKEFSMMVQKKIWTVNNDHLNLALLLVRLSDLKESRNAALASNETTADIKQIQRWINRVYTEIARRMSVGFSLISFTLLGAACGMSIGRRQSVRGVVIVILLAALYLAAYFSARSIDQLLVPSIILYGAPHLLIILTSLWLLRRVNKGIE